MGLARRALLVGVGVYLGIWFERYQTLMGKRLGDEAEAYLARVSDG